MRNYRAFISVPVFAENDDDAQDKAYEYACSLATEGEVMGHLELLGEGEFSMGRVVVSVGPNLLDQLRHVRWWEFG